MPHHRSGQWSKALEVCEGKDRIHLRNTYYNYAKHLEAMGDLRTAVPMYEKSGTHKFEVIRLEIVVIILNGSL